MRFSDKQELIINESTDNILVSAAAGSGKTTVLVERIIRKIISGEMSLDRVLVLTFTRKAAENMQIKIGKEIREKLKTETDAKIRRMLKEQLNLLPGSYIQTINSFCTRVIKEKGNELPDGGMEPGLILISDAEKQMLLRRAASEALEQTYLSFKSSEELERSSFYKLTLLFGDGRNDGSLTEHMTEIFSKLRSLPDYILRARNIVDDRKVKDAEGTVIMLDKAVRVFRDVYMRARPSCEMCLRSIDDVIFAKKGNDERVGIARQTLSALKDEIDGMLAKDAPSEEYFELIKESIRRISYLEPIELGGKDPTLKEFKKIYAPCAALLVLAMGKMRNYGTLTEDYLPGAAEREILRYGVDELLDLQKERTSITESFVDLLSVMDERYKALKKRLHAMDFSDQEHYAYEVLKVPSAAEYYRDRFSEIYVDEYQDNSTIQDGIIALFSKDNVFMVGDVKQSIYKFRYANPGMFKRRMDSYRTGDGGKLLLLNNNYRSTPEILDFVNVIFGQLMSEDATEIEYDEDQMLFPSPEAKRDNDIPKILFVTDPEDEGTDEEDEENEDGYFSDLDGLSKARRAEVLAVMSEIEEYMKVEGHELSDICVLTRTNNVSRGIATILNKTGIPAISGDDRNIYDDPDIAALTSLITILGNEHRDECMVGVLLAGFRFSNFTVDELADITAYAKSCGLLSSNLSVKLRIYRDRDESTVPDEEKDLFIRVGRFLDVFDDLRSDSLMLNISELLEKIYAATGILATVKERDSSEIVKLREFKNWLCDNYMSRGSDISSVAESLESLKVEVNESATFAFESTVGNAVTCMTFHKSKGLEFKFVIVAGMDLKRKGGSGNMIFDEKFGFIADDYIDSGSAVRLKSLERVMYDREEKLASTSEELRLLYVALTRAMQELTVVSYFRPGKLTGSYGSHILEEENMKIGRDIHMLLKNTTEELKASLIRLSCADIMRDEGPLKTIPFDKVRIILRETDESKRPSASLSIKNDLVKKADFVGRYDPSGNPVFKRYRYEDSVSIPSKTSVSEIKKESARKAYDRGGDISPKIPINLIVPDIEYFERKDRYISASSKGTLIHDLLRYMDFVRMKEGLDAGRSDRDVLNDEIGYLSDAGIVRDPMKPVIEEFKDVLILFMRSEVFSRIAGAEKNGRAYFEKPITFAMRGKGDNDTTLVQGVLDVMFIEDDGAVIVDYKTDRIDDREIEDVRQKVILRHRDQLEMYAAAVEASGIKVKSKSIWLIRRGLEIVI